MFYKLFMPLPIFLKDYLFLIVFLRFKNVVFPGEKPGLAGESSG